MPIEDIHEGSEEEETKEEIEEAVVFEADSPKLETSEESTTDKIDVADKNGDETEIESETDEKELVPVLDVKKMEEELFQAELLLRTAMMESNVEMLDELIHDDLFFTNHVGQIMTKEDDLKAHRAKMVTIDDIQLSDVRVRCNHTDVGVVTVAAKIDGSFMGNPFHDQLRFTRIWSKDENTGKWQILVGHSSVIVQQPQS